MTTKIYDPKRCCPVQYEKRGGERVWFGRHIGIVLKFGSNGGNYTRNFKSNSVWKKLFRKGRDYVELPAGFPKRGGQKAIWLTDRGLVMSLKQVMRERAAKDDLEGASDVSRFVQWLIKEAPLGNLFVPAAVPIFEEIILGAGVALNINRGRLESFRVLDEDDRPIIVRVKDLDKGWKQKLLKALT